MSEADGRLVESILTRMETIDGWLNEPEALLLMQMTALALGGGTNLAVVEVGSYLGRSTVVIGLTAAAVSPGARVFAVDPHAGEFSRGDAISVGPGTLEAFERNIDAAGLQETVEVVQKKSHEVDWRLPIGLLFIDALHDYENVSRDFAHFSPWITAGGFVAFDDDHAGYPGVVRVVDEAMAGGEFQPVARSGRLTVLQRTPPGAGGGDRTGPRERRRSHRFAELVAAVDGQSKAVRLLRTLVAHDDGLESLRAAPPGQEQARLASSLGSKLVEIEDVSTAPLDPDRLVGRSIDLPRAGALGGRTGFGIAGWVLARSAEVTAVEFTQAGSLLGRTETRMSRPDVGRAHPEVDDAGNSGFSAWVPLSSAGDPTVEVTAVLDDEERVLIGTVRARRPPL